MKASREPMSLVPARPAGRDGRRRSTLDGRANCAAAGVRSPTGSTARRSSRSTRGASLETVVAVVGCLLAGVPVVPVPPDAGPREREHVLTRLGRGVVARARRAGRRAAHRAGRRHVPARAPHGASRTTAPR